MSKFTAPAKISPFYGNVRIPRKLKKKVKNYVGTSWSGQTNGERLWHYMEFKNIDYKWFLINKICENYGQN